MNKSSKRELKEICNREVGSKSLGWIENLIKPYIPFKESINSRYSGYDYFYGLLYASIDNGSAESSGEFTSPDTILRTCKFPVKQLRNIRDNMIYGIVHLAKKHGMFQHPVDIAIDGYDDPYYGDRNDIHVTGTQQKAGTNYAHSFLCADSIISGERFNLGFENRTKFTIDADIVETLIRKASEMVNIRIVMMDKEFYQVRIVKTLYHNNLKFIIPAPDTAGIMNVKYDNRHNLPIVVNYVMTSATGDQVNVNLVLIKRKDKIHGFITNLNWEPNAVAEHYRNRWGIETNNRVRNELAAMTTSRSFELRFIYYLMSVMLHNIWIFLNHLASIIVNAASQIMMRVYEMQRIILKSLGL